MEIIPGSDNLLQLSIAIIVLTALAILLRFAIRLQSKTSFAADDWWLLTSATCFYGYTGPLIWCLVNPEYTQPLALPPVSVMEPILKLEYAVTPLAISTVATAKVSVLCLYRRIFSTQSFRRNSLIVGLCVVSYWIISVTGFLLRCKPVRGAWQTSDPKECINVPAFFLVLELFNCLIDVIMICLPLGVIRELQMPAKRKAALAIIFLLGGLVLVVGIVRMATTYRANSSELPFVPNVITTTMENGFAIICACMPTYGPVLAQSKGFASWVEANYHTFLKRGRGRLVIASMRDTYCQASNTGDEQHRNRYQQIADGANTETHLTKMAPRSSTRDDMKSGRSSPLDTNEVVDTVDMVPR